MALLVLTGASGSGKTTLAKAVHRELPTAEVMFFDSIGVPPVEEMAKWGDGHQPGGAWQRAMTLQWVERISASVRSGKSVVFEGQMRPEFIREALQLHGLRATVLLIDCDDATREHRLHGDRGQPELAHTEMMDWARYLRDEAAHLGYERIDTVVRSFDECVADLIARLQRLPSSIVRSSDVSPSTSTNGQFVHTARRLSAAAKATSLGVSLYEVPAGKTAFPFHFHSACEEGFYILDGEGAVRIGAESYPVRAGDYIASPPGPDLAHQLINTGTTALRYLAMSAPAVYLGMDIVGYPDSNKVAFSSGVKPGTVAWRDGAWVMKLIKSDTPNTGYFDDEPLAK